MMFRFSILRFVLPVLSAILIAGCSGPHTLSGQGAIPDMSLAPNDAGSATTKTAALSPPPAQPEAGRLMGLTPMDIEALLGKPSLVRVEMAAQIMQFMKDDCVLDVFLTEPQPGAQFRTQHVEARDRNGHFVPEEHCLATLIPQELW